MTINRKRLKRIIKEEMQKYLKEADSGNPFPDLEQKTGRRVQAAFPGPYNPEAPSAMGGSESVQYYEQVSFNDGIGAWGGLEDIAIIAGEKPGSIEMWHKTNGKWRFGAGVDLEPWQ
jgi:hypothetical protein